MNLNNYVITNDDGYTGLQYFNNLNPEDHDQGSFIMFLDAGISLHDVLIKVQHFENQINEDHNQENGNL